MQRNTTSLIASYDDRALNFENHSVLKLKFVAPWQKIVKRSLDIVVAITGLLFFIPLMIYIALRIKFDSKGSIFYFQERIGYNGIPFTIFKFRSMFEHSEKDGPRLSSANDKRVTKWGRTIRKWKLDELPQLLNVLKGDMSLVGPRPERKYYIDKAMLIYPYFRHLHQVKPGLTSLGMIKFGYAQNVQQIVQRMRYDLTYIENYSLLLDFLILYYTPTSIIDGKLFRTSLKFRTKLQRFKLHTLN